MSLRYRKRIKVGEGLYINLSKYGFSSISIGKPGFTTNIGKNGSSVTIGLPGTGLSYKKNIISSKSDEASLPEKDSNIELIEMAARDSLKACEKASKLNEKIHLKTASDLWGEAFEKIKAEFDKSKVLHFNGSFINVFKILKALNTRSGECLFIHNTPFEQNIEIDGFIQMPQKKFGVIYPIASEGIFSASDFSQNNSKVDDFTLGIDLESLKLDDNHRKHALNFLLSYWIIFMALSVSCILLIFKIPGFWYTVLGLLLFYYPLLFWLKQMPNIVSKGCQRNLSIIYHIYFSRDRWNSIFESEKSQALENLLELKRNAITGENIELMMSSAFMVNVASDTDLEELSDPCKSFDFNLDYIADDTFISVLKLPNLEKIIYPEKLTPGGKFSVERKTTKMMNEEYAQIIMNMAFYFLVKLYSLYPKTMKIKLIGQTSRIDESTGNYEDQTILYFDSKRDDLLDVNFSLVNPLKLSSRLGYRFKIDGSFFMEKIDFNRDEVNAAFLDLESIDEDSEEQY
jgi:Protein of unknown function (DUF4236)